MKRIGIPPLAGVCTIEEAARVGLSVDENVRRLVRYHRVEQRLGGLLLARLPSTPEWEAKGAFALHQWLDAEHAHALRNRCIEMRHPAPVLDAAPSAGLESFLEELEPARDTAELIAGVYTVARPALAAAYRSHLRETNPLADQPTHRLLRILLEEEEQAIAWGEAALEALIAGDVARRESLARWRAHLDFFLRACGGVAGPDDETASAEPMGERPVPRSRAGSAAAPPAADFTPRRDARFHGGHDFDFLPHIVYALPHVSAAERNLALLCKRLLEMDVPEMMASFIVQDDALPWEVERLYRRQLWDEARHSMLGEVVFESRGVDWARIPLNVGFSLRLNLHATPRERELVLYAIEQSLMPGDTGKRFEYETACAAGDALSAQFHDYDWADEVLHARIGRSWLRRVGLQGEDALEQGREVNDRTWRDLERYRADGASANEALTWWRDFVRTVLGRESDVRQEDMGSFEAIPARSS